MDARTYPQGSGAVKPVYVQIGTGPKTLIFPRGPLIPGVEHVLRRRATIAEVNAGFELLPAIPGFKYRIADMALIAVGGAVTGATDVRVLGTRSGSGVALLAAAVAALTQSTLLRAGAANAVVLADGASLTPLDANTAVTGGKTGGTGATATHVDFLLTYTIEAA